MNGAHPPEISGRILRSDERATCLQRRVMSRARPTQKTARGMRKWKSVRMAPVWRVSCMDVLLASVGWIGATIKTRGVGCQGWGMGDMGDGGGTNQAVRLAGYVPISDPTRTREACLNHLSLLVLIEHWHRLLRREIGSIGNRVECRSSPSINKVAAGSLDRAL